MRRVFWLAAAVAALAASSVFADEQAHGSAATTTGSAGAAAVASSASAYPLDVCIVSGEKLGEMGDPVVKDYDGREVKFCCKMCVKTFEKDQAKWLKKIDDAIVAKEKDTYPLTTCVVSGEKLGGMGDPVDYVYQNQLVRFCCKNCIPTFTKEPAKYMAMITAAKQGPAKESEKKE